MAIKAADRNGPTLKELADLFLADHVETKRKPATELHYRHLLEKAVLPELGNRKADKITTADLARLHTKMKARPYMANRTIGGGQHVKLRHQMKAVASRMQPRSRHR